MSSKRHFPDLKTSPNPIAELLAAAERVRAANNSDRAIRLPSELKPSTPPRTVLSISF
jgi:hypothetical protein